jgi:hypothetical protein
MREQFRKRQGPASDSIKAFEDKVVAIAGTPGGGRFGPRGPVAGGPDTLASVSATLGQLMREIEGADVAPTRTQAAAIADRHAALIKLIERWNALKTTDMPKLNGQLKQAGLPELAE